LLISELSEYTVVKTGVSLVVLIRIAISTP
jgi:hypothetical protein